MIDWFSVAANSLWILGLSVLLATLSYSDWKRSEKKLSLRAVLGEFMPSLCINIGLLLFCLGLLLTTLPKHYESYASTTTQRSSIITSL